MPPRSRVACSRFSFESRNRPKDRQKIFEGNVPIEHGIQQHQDELATGVEAELVPKEARKRFRAVGCPQIASNGRARTAFDSEFACVAKHRADSDPCCSSSDSKAGRAQRSRHEGEGTEPRLERRLARGSARSRNPIGKLFDGGSNSEVPISG